MRLERSGRNVCFGSKAAIRRTLSYTAVTVLEGGAWHSLRSSVTRTTASRVSLLRPLRPLRFAGRPRVRAR